MQNMQKCKIAKLQNMFFLTQHRNPAITASIRKQLRGWKKRAYARNSNAAASRAPTVLVRVLRGSYWWQVITSIIFHVKREGRLNKWAHSRHWRLVVLSRRKGKIAKRPRSRKATIQRVRAIGKQRSIAWDAGVTPAFTQKSADRLGRAKHRASSAIYKLSPMLSRHQ